MCKPLLIAGPCAAECEEQLMMTARLLRDQLEESDFSLTYYRAGVWKPRSEPASFKGAGKKSLPWLNNIQKEFGFKVCVEVAKPEHLDYCEQYDIHHVWIGSRTTVNPFLVEELAEASKGRELTVMVKNPIIPDLKLWIGAITRFLDAGISDIIAIHRGVPDANENVFRNAPFWEMPIDLKVHFPDMPLICDISHIAGDKKLLQQIAQIALDFCFDGLMVETHHDPSVALSDSKQQITPFELLILLNNLNFKQPASSPAEESLRKQRTLIQHVDFQISTLLKKRMEIVDEIAKIKTDHNLPIVNAKQFNKIRDIYFENSLPDNEFQEFIHQYLESLHQCSVQRQKKL